MPKFWVSIPIAGSVKYSDIEAVDEEQAKELAWQYFENGEDGDVTWAAYEKIAEGNCLCVPDTDVEVGREHEETEAEKKEREDAWRRPIDWEGIEAAKQLRIRRQSMKSPIILEGKGFDWDAGIGAMDRIADDAEQGETNLGAAMLADPGCMKCPNCDVSLWKEGKKVECPDCGHVWVVD